MVQVRHKQVYRFAGFTLDLAKGVLPRDDEPAPQRPKAQALLTHLAMNSGRVVPKSELMDTVWPGIFVTGDSFTQSFREVRKVLGDESQKVIRTVSRRGYMLAPDTRPYLSEKAQPILAVLKFRNETGDETQSPLIDGFAEEIINGVARFRIITVLARHSSFSIAAAGPDDWGKARDLIGEKDRGGQRPACWCDHGHGRENEGPGT